MASMVPIITFKMHNHLNAQIVLHWGEDRGEEVFQIVKMSSLFFTHTHKKKAYLKNSWPEYTFFEGGGGYPMHCWKNLLLEHLFLKSVVNNKTDCKPVEN